MEQMAQTTEKRVRETLGADRVTGVDWYVKTNFDGLEVLRVCVRYDSTRPLSVDDMTRVVDALIADMPNIDAPFPVVDFQADTDNEPVAAE